MNTYEEIAQYFALTPCKNSVGFMVNDTPVGLAHIEGKYSLANIDAETFMEFDRTSAELWIKLPGRGDNSTAKKIILTTVNALKTIFPKVAEIKITERPSLLIFHEGGAKVEISRGMRLKIRLFSGTLKI